MKKRRGYAQVCPLAKAAEILCERWTLLVVRELILGSRRFGELRRGIPTVSPTMLSQRLRELEDGGVIVRGAPPGAAKSGGSAEYALTAAGHELAPVLFQMSEWGHRWAVRDLRRQDLEPSYVMWVAHKTLRVDRLELGARGQRSRPGTRIVIAYMIADAASALRRWWIVKDEAGVELCLKHPGYPVDVTVSTELRPMSEMLLGKLCPREAVRTGAVVLSGAPALIKSFPAWYPRSYDYAAGRGSR